MNDKQLKEISVSIEMNKVSVPTSAERTIKRDHIKLKRNSICPCDNNMTSENPKKYKHCCLKNIHAQEQKAYEMTHENKRTARAKKNVAASIQYDIDHPILLPSDRIITPSGENNKIIIP